jgi:transglutaminase-like putative cysteine protease
MDLTILHSTNYHFGSPVTLGRHRLMLRPRDSFDMRILETSLVLSPSARTTWTHDAYGNSICWAVFGPEPVMSLTIDSKLWIRRYEPAYPRPARIHWIPGIPVAYGVDELPVLQPFITPATAEDDTQLRQLAENLAQTAAQYFDHPLLALADGLHRRLIYRMRFEEGTQAPAETLRLGSGTCRDYAWLFIECARRIGYAARFVTGYLHSGSSPMTVPDIGYSHAWAEVYVPGDGWIEFDPTNLLVGDRQLIRVAVTRTPGEASPVMGEFTGAPQLVTPEVRVTVAPSQSTISQATAMTRT